MAPRRAGFEAAAEPAAVAPEWRGRERVRRQLESDFVVLFERLLALWHDTVPLHLFPQLSVALHPSLVELPVSRRFMAVYSIASSLDGAWYSDPAALAFKFDEERPLELGLVDAHLLPPPDFLVRCLGALHMLCSRGGRLRCSLLSDCLDAACSSTCSASRTRSRLR